MVSKSTVADNLGFVGLYPHEFDNFVLIVPSLSVRQKFIDNFLKSKMQYLIVMILAIVALFRYLLRYLTTSRNYDWVRTCIDTFGSFLATSANNPVYNNPEKVFLTTMYMSFMVVTVYFSGLIFKTTLLLFETSNIATISEFAETRYAIYVPHDLGCNKGFWRENMEYKVYFVANKMLMQFFSANVSLTESLPSKSQLFYQCF